MELTDEQGRVLAEALADAIVRQNALQRSVASYRELLAAAEGDRLACAEQVKHLVKELPERFKLQAYKAALQGELDG